MNGIYHVFEVLLFILQVGSQYIMNEAVVLLLALGQSDPVLTHLSSSQDQRHLRERWLASRAPS